MAFQIGQPGVSAFLQSLIRELDVIIEMGDYDLHFDIEMELKEVKNLLLGFEDVLLDAERRRQFRKKGAEKWMLDLKDLLYNIDDSLDEIKMEKQQLQQEITGQSSNSKVRYNFSDSFFTMKNIKNGLGQVLDMLRKLTKEAHGLELRRDVVQHDAIWLESHAKVRPKSGCFADEPLIHGRKKDKSEIIEMLLREDGGVSKRKYEFVCVVGMGGLGKTTLAQLVFQDESVNSFFAVRGWVCVSDIFDVIKVTQDLIESAAENAEKGGGAANMPSGSLPALQARLKKIINNQRFLLVLDDVWTTDVLKELIGPLNFGATGSKILVTTRLGKVAEDLGNKKFYKLERLEDTQCLKIFEDNAFAEGDGIDNDEDLMKIGEEIVRKCKGVPLVAKVIAAMLIGEDKGKWKAVKDNDLWNLAYQDEGLHPGLRLSYFYLPPFLKRCFEYFALFPSDFKFKQDELVRMWMAEGLIEEKEGTEPEEMGDKYYNDLKGRSLIQNNNMMHDMVHHLACIVSGCFFLCDSSGSNSSTSSRQSVRHAFIHDKPDLLDEANKLRTLIHNGDFCQELFSYKWLRVLRVWSSKRYFSYLPSSVGCDLKHLRYLKLMGKFENSILPDSLCMLTNLQVLDLSHCSNLKNLPQDVGKLSNLRFLRLRKTGITGLPDSVCSLSNLRVLDLYWCKSLTTLPNDVGNLQTLHELILYWSSISSLPESVVNATNLRVLTLSDDVVTLPAHIGKLTKLERLDKYWVGKEKGRGIDELKSMDRIKGRLQIFNMENIPSGEEALMANLRSKKHIEDLEFVWKEFDAALTGRDGEREVRVIEALEPNAAIKYLSFENYVGHKFPSWMSTASLRNLTTLYLINLPGIREMTGIEFESLQFLRFHSCPALREVSITTPKLDTLEAQRCNELKKISLCALQTSKCDYCHLDRSVKQLKATNASPCTKLRKLRVRIGGDNGITWLPVGWASILTSLEILELNDLPPMNFKIISEEGEKCCVAPSELMPSISILIIQNSPALVSLESLELPPRLETLWIQNCPNLRNLPYGSPDLTYLIDINIWACPTLEIRPDDPLLSLIRHKRMHEELRQNIRVSLYTHLASMHFTSIY